MTATLILQNVDDSIVERLSILASSGNRTVEQQALVLLEEVLPVRRRFDRAKIAASIAAMTPRDVQQTDSVVLLRQDRARDDDAGK